jgi:RsmE family RNA methyltransferase
MTVRLHVGALPAVGQTLVLPEDAARHAQVRRVQPGDWLRVFDGAGREHEAQVQTMGRREVALVLGPAVATTPEPELSITLAVGVPANERMDTLVEKAVELGAAAIQPLACERTVLRLEGERAVRRQAHWQDVAVAACEQCGRAFVPPVAPMQAVAPRWPEFLRGQRERCEARQRRTGLPPHLLDQLGAFLQGPVPEGPDVMLTGEFTPFNLLAEGAQHTGMIHFCLADGSVRPVMRSMDYVAFQNMSSMAEGVVTRLPRAKSRWL